MTTIARAAPRRGDGMTTVHNNNSRPVAGQGNARRELHLERRAKGNRNDEQFNVQRRYAQ
jgi:hypothetical protein